MSGVELVLLLLWGCGTSTDVPEIVHDSGQVEEAAQELDAVALLSRVSLDLRGVRPSL